MSENSFADGAQHGMSPALIAGRDLDALIAEKVMGWTWRKNTKVRSGGLPDFAAGTRTLSPDDDCGMLKRATGNEPISVGLMRRVPYYSSNIADAWSVVAKMRKQDFSLDMQISSGPMNSCRVQFWPNDCADEDGIVFADHAPEAICRAALAAIGEL